MPGVPTGDLFPGSRFRLIDTVRDFDAVRVDGWLIRDEAGQISYVEAGAFEIDFEQTAPAESNRADEN